MEYSDGHIGYSKAGTKNAREMPSHKIILTGRNQGIISGVLEVIEFDNNMVNLDTSMGRLLIKGRDMKVTGINLEKGEVLIEGSVDNILYTKKADNESLLKKLFK